MRRGIVDWFFVSLPFMRRERRERCSEIPNNPKRGGFANWCEGKCFVRMGKDVRP